jgi:RNA polymerase sigma-70 factor (ECF subfamily)
MTGVAVGELELGLERHRVELTGYCYRMLGSAFDAEDAVQDTLARAWRSADRFEGRSSMRSWLYRIATNVCIDALNGRKRRARPMDLGPASHADATLPRPRPEEEWVLPAPDDRILPAVGGDPAELVVAQESVRLAFIAALQHLPPKQRAVLILREVLRWKAAEVADLLDASTASVNSALQRARATLAAAGVSGRIDPDAAPEPGDERQRELLRRYVDAFQRYDMDAILELLHEDIEQSMPPYELWLRGHADIRKWWLGPGIGCAGSRLLTIAANGSPAFGQYKPSGPGGSFEPWAIQVVEISGDRIGELTFFLDAERLFPLFGLPERLEG